MATRGKTWQAKVSLGNYLKQHDMKYRVGTIKTDDDEFMIKLIILKTVDIELPSEWEGFLLVVDRVDKIPRGKS